MSTRYAWVALVTLWTGFTGVACGTQYVVTDLGTLGGTASQASGINAKGQIVGLSTTAAGPQHAFLFSGGKMTDLGTLGGDSAATGVNDNGQVVGYSATSAGATHAFLYDKGSMNDLQPSGGESYAAAINAQGQIVGHRSANGVTSAFLYSGGTITTLGSFSGASFATGINGAGQVAMYAASAPMSANYHSYLRSGETMTDLGMIDGSWWSLTSAVNAKGQVVGWGGSAEFYNEHAYLYSNGAMKDLGTLSGCARSQATGINTAAQVVGFSYSLADDSSRVGQHAFVYTNDTMTDLNSLIDVASGWTLEAATAINDLGQIAGYGVSPSGQEHAFLLTPVPEPSTAVLLGVGVCLLACVWRRRGDHRRRITTRF
ncbi:MAG: PEP-CTERM sorting domain-containing protein [Thermoguttaceae bacterium]